ncbi:zinc finger protein 831 [Denticeps clupeoides]|uniref:C2H2-type domain-containing protein n=1 Tax=Denticeps clupeoides TaxID=299321 RepID=A0AAY4EIZ2_9TELE|nr:uncharacterized protein LOC114800554 [Denticeps clupeoides]XP_028853889.1 uncharacterized protein LOC114800554 [Denticeps clupeoides]
METGKQGCERMPEPERLVSAPRADGMRVPAPLTAVYVHAMPSQPLTQLPASGQEAAAIALPIPTLCARQSMPLLTFHIAGGVPLQMQGQKPGAAKPKSAGKHVCSECGRDCLKPSVLEKHRRCHTGERPYPCITCGISFKTQSNLYKHRRTQAHARLSSESDRGSLSSNDSLQSPKDTCCSSSSLEGQSQDFGSLDLQDNVPLHKSGTAASLIGHVQEKLGLDTEWASQQDALGEHVQEQKDVSPSVQKEQTSDKADSHTPNADGHLKKLSSDHMASNRHIPLHRQEAKLWDSMSSSRGKSQSHDSTDSGFSDNGEHHWLPSPTSGTHEQSIESLPGSRMEFSEQRVTSNTESDLVGSKTKVSVQEQRKLEERISSIISKNDALMADKHLENVRPRKMVLSKQGSIDLPMPYTYKDSFHFEMKSSSRHTMSWHSPDRKGRPAFYSSVPTQHSDSQDHAPLTRSSSMPFNLGGLRGERAPPHHADSLMLGRRSSAGHLHSLKYGTTSVDQQAPSHRSLVRQGAVDCVPGSDGSPAERGSSTGLNSDYDSSDTTGKKCRRRKAPKFAYEKWYMYGDGAFKKLYSEEKDEHYTLKSRRSFSSLEQPESLESEARQRREPVLLVSTVDVVPPQSKPLPACSSSCLAACPPPANMVQTAEKPGSVISPNGILQSSAVKSAIGPLQHVSCGVIQSFDISSETGTAKERPGDKNPDFAPQHRLSPLPSERKKQRTEEDTTALAKSADIEMKGHGVPCYETRLTGGGMSNGVNQSLASVSSDIIHKADYAAAQRESNRLAKPCQGSPMHHHHPTPRQALEKRHSSPLCAASASSPPGCQISASVPAKSSFLPKYQLKLPHATAGGSEPCLPSTFKQAETIRRQSNFPSTQIFTTCARPGQNDYITSYTTLTRCQPATPSATLLLSQRSAADHLRVTTQNAPLPLLSASSEKGPFGKQASAMEKTPLALSSSAITPSPEMRPAAGLATAVGSQIYTPPAIHIPAPHISALANNQSATSATSATSGVTLSSSRTGSHQQNSTATKTMASHGIVTFTSTSVRSKPGTSTASSQQSSFFSCRASSPGSVGADAPSTRPRRQQEGDILQFSGFPETPAQNTYYVRTADLQIVMQIISDEQLALMEPQIEGADYHAEARARGDGAMNRGQAPSSRGTCSDAGVSMGFSNPSAAAAQVTESSHPKNDQAPLMLCSDSSEHRTNGHVSTQSGSTSALEIKQKLDFKQSGDAHHVQMVEDGADGPADGAAAHNGIQQPSARPTTPSVCESVQGIAGEVLKSGVTCFRDLPPSMSDKVEPQMESAKCLLSRARTSGPCQSVRLPPGPIGSNSSMAEQKLAGEVRISADTSLTTSNQKQTQSTTGEVKFEQIVSVSSEKSCPNQSFKHTPETSQQKAGYTGPAQVSISSMFRECRSHLNPSASKGLLSQTSSVVSTSSHKELVPSELAGQQKLGHVACVSPANEQEVTPGNVLVPISSQNKPLHERSTCNTDQQTHKCKIPARGASTSGAFHQPQQVDGTRGFVASTSHGRSEEQTCCASQRRIIACNAAIEAIQECMQEHSQNLGEPNKVKVNKAFITGPGEGGSHQSPLLQKENGTEKPGQIPKEPESMGSGERNNKQPERRDPRQEPSRDNKRTGHVSCSDVIWTHEQQPPSLLIMEASTIPLTRQPDTSGSNNTQLPTCNEINVPNPSQLPAASSPHHHLPHFNQNQILEPAEHAKCCKKSSEGFSVESGDILHSSHGHMSFSDTTSHGVQGDTHPASCTGEGSVARSANMRRSLSEGPISRHDRVSLEVKTSASVDLPSSQATTSLASPTQACVKAHTSPTGQSCIDDTENSYSSDEEGRLVIEI